MLNFDLVEKLKVHFTWFSLGFKKQQAESLLALMQIIIKWSWGSHLMAFKRSFKRLQQNLYVSRHFLSFFCHGITSKFCLIYMHVGFSHVIAKIYLGITSISKARNFFVSYLAGPRPALGQWQGENISRLIRIVLQCQFWPKSLQQPYNEVCPKSQPSTLMGFEPGTFNSELKFYLTVPFSLFLCYCPILPAHVVCVTCCFEYLCGK